MNDELRCKRCGGPLIDVGDGPECNNPVKANLAQNDGEAMTANLKGIEAVLKDFRECHEYCGEELRTIERGSPSWEKWNGKLAAYQYCKEQLEAALAALGVQHHE